MIDLKKIHAVECNVPETPPTHLAIEVHRAGLECISYHPDPFLPCEVVQYEAPELYSPFEMRDVIEDIFVQDPIFKHDYSRITLCYNLPEVFAVPSKMHAGEDGKMLLAGMFGENNLAKIFTGRLPNGEAITWRADERLHAHLKALMPQAEFTHRYVLEGYDVQRFNCIEVRFYKGFLQLFGYGNRRLPVVAYKPYVTAHDVAYHLLAFATFLQADASIIPILYSGKIDDKSSVLAEIKKYFLNVAPAAIKGQRDFENLEAGYSMHYYYPLLNLAKCAS